MASFGDGGRPWAAITQAACHAMHAAWVGFATGGNPGWPAYDLDRRAAMRFETTSEVATTRGLRNAQCGTAYGSHRHDCHPMSGDRVPAAPERRFPGAGGTVHRIWAVLAACPEDPPSVLGGGVLVRWSERGTFVVVTTPGSGVVNQRLVTALADHVHLVGPRR